MLIFCHRWDTAESLSRPGAFPSITFHAYIKPLVQPIQGAKFNISGDEEKFEDSICMQMTDLMRQLEDIGDITAYSVIDDGCVQLKIGESNGVNKGTENIGQVKPPPRKWDFLYHLPVDAISIVVVCQDCDFKSCSIQTDMESRMENALSTWKALGNHIPDRSLVVALGSDDEQSEILEASRILACLSHVTCRPCSLVSENYKNANLADMTFDVEQWSNENSQQYALTLKSLTRNRPIQRSGNNQSKTRSRGQNNSKRIESFALAMSADIAPNDIVLDPMCKRGTFLIEAAKYWPSAQYIGMDSNRGHLEHVAMNGQSCGVYPIALYHCGDPFQTSSVLKSTTAHKIMTCLPFGKSKTFYAKLLEEYSSVLKENGKMIMVVDVQSLPAMMDATDSVGRCHPLNRLDVTVVRKPFFPWGKQRSTIVILTKGGKKETTSMNQSVSSPYTGLLPWEKLHCSETDARSSRADQICIWEEIRDGMVPCLTPCSRPR
jgi:tRNA G46 methylase TrmB